MKGSKLTVIISGIAAAFTAATFAFTISKQIALGKLVPPNYSFTRYKDGKVVVQEYMPHSIGLKRTEYSPFKVKRGFFDDDDDGRVDTIINHVYSTPSVLNINPDYENFRVVLPDRNIESVEVLKRSSVNTNQFIEADFLLKKIKDKILNSEPTEKNSDYVSWNDFRPSLEYFLSNNFEQ